MPERDHGLYAALAEEFELFNVMLHGALVENPALGLYPAPLQAEPAALQAHTGHELRVLLPALPVHGGYRGVRAILYISTPVPVVPVVVFVPALDLRRRAGRAQQHPAERKSVCHGSTSSLIYHSTFFADAKDKNGESLPRRAHRRNRVVNVGKGRRGRRPLPPFSASLL